MFAHAQLLNQPERSAFVQFESIRFKIMVLVKVRVNYWS